MASFIVARAEVEHDIRLEPEPPRVVDVRVGEPFRVTLAYRCRETSPKRETWCFRLVSALGGTEPAQTEKTVHDRRGRIDAVWSHVGQEHVCEQPGEHVLTFRAEVETALGEWGEDDQSSVRKTYEGTWKVRAREA